MAFRSLRLIKNIYRKGFSSNLDYNVHVFQNGFMSASTITTKNIYNAVIEHNTDNNITYLDDPDTFGMLTPKLNNDNIKEDEGDVKEEKYLYDIPLKSQQLTTRQYADIIKQYIKHKRLKEALDVIEVRMLQEDRVKPENYIYNILIGACADVGYTKKAFKLYNDMKKRALKPTGDTYTCLFTACLNSPWVTDGLKNASHLRALMKEKGIEPNVTNYNVMIKTFGRCGDLPTAFQIVDEMISKKIKIRVHTFNHLLQACITDKENGLRHALVVWRKMLKMREKPNVYSFNLMLKCVKDCNLGSKEDINDLIGILQQNMAFNIAKPNKILQIETPTADQQEQQLSLQMLTSGTENTTPLHSRGINKKDENELEKFSKPADENDMVIRQEVSLTNQDNISIQLVDNKKQLPQLQNIRSVPNLLSRTLQMNQVFALQDVHTLQDKFAVIGGQEDFLKEMEVYAVRPNIKIFTQMLPLIDDSTEAEINLMKAMQLAKVKPDIDFYNLLIRKRCLRLDYDKALEVKDMIVKDGKKRHPFNKKQKLKENIMTYGVLAMACGTKDEAIVLLEEMKNKQIRLNIQIMGTLLKHGTVNIQFDYVKYVMNKVKEENVVVNDIFIKHLEDFNDKCLSIIKQNNEKGTENKRFSIAHSNFTLFYKTWLKDVNAEEALKSEHPWQQFRESYPETVQRLNFKVKEPKRFYKRNRKFVNYTPKVQ